MPVTTGRVHNIYTPKSLIEQYNFPRKSIHYNVEVFCDAMTLCAPNLNNNG